jgi:hypothetical protein
MLCLGPGEDYAALHNPDYDFPDDLIPIGCAIFERIARDLLGTASDGTVIQNELEPFRAVS